MKLETMIARAAAESPDFGRYAEVMLEAIPDLKMATLRDLYEHKATPAEYFAHMDRIRRGAHGEKP